MDKINLKSQKIIYNIIYIILVFILVYLFGLGINLDLSLSLQFITVIIMSLLVKFFLFNPLILYIILAIGTTIGIILNHYVKPFIVPLSERIYHLIDNIFLNFIGKENIAYDNILLYWGILIIMVSLMNSFILFKNKSIYLLLPVYIGFSLYYWYNYYDEAYPAITVFFLVFFILLGLSNFIKETNKLNLDIDNEILYYTWIKTAIKYSILIVAISLFLPKNYNYIRWPWLQQKVYTTFPFVEELRSYDAFSRDSGGATLFNFSMTEAENGLSRLGGPVNLSDKKIMTIYSSEGHYLRGNVQQTYTGSEWQSIVKPSATYNTGVNFSDWTRDYLNLYFRNVTLIIQNHDFASFTLFGPYKAASVGFEIESEIIVNRDNTLIFPNGVYSGESYSISAQKPLPYGVLLANGVNFSKSDIDHIDIYLQIPENRITDRTKELVKKIVKDKQSDYEKTIALENYLRMNYDYNLSPKNVPEGYEFIDYFLFEGREGYCTYYATAMAIMLRLEGIPSRYVEGYLALEPVEDGIYEVRHNNAHAWVEAFIEPVGWIQFEPTPALPLLDRMEDYQIEEEKDNHNTDDITNNESEIDDFINRPEVTDDNDLGYNGALIIDEEFNHNKFSNELALNILIFGIIMILPIRYLLGLYKYNLNELRIKKLPNEQRAIHLYDQIVKLIGIIGFPQNSGETHYEYAQRVGYKFYNISKDEFKGFKEITDIFVRSKYGGTTLDEDILILEEFKNVLETRLKNQIGIIRYYYNKYVKMWK